MSKNISFSTKVFYSFNLIPPKSKEEVKTIEKRDNTIVYSFILLFSAALVYFIMSSYQAVKLTPKIKDLETNIQTIQNQIDYNQDILILNGELITKGNILLKPILENDVKLREIIDISNEIALTGKVIDYTLEDKESQMVIKIELLDKKEIIEIYKAALLNEKIKDIAIRSLNIDEKTSNINLELEFKFNTV